MKAIILAGGTGTRLRTLVRSVPKPMAEVAGKPFLEYLINQLGRWGIHEVIFSIGYKGEMIRDYFENGDKWGKKILYSSENIPLGTGGAIKKAIKLTHDEQFIIMNGDSFLDINFDKLISFHNETSALASIGLYHVADVSRYGQVKLSGLGEIQSFTEKSGGHTGTPGMINGGVYVAARRVFERLPEGNLSFEKHVLPDIVTKGLYGLVTTGFFRDIGTPCDYTELKKNPRQLFDAVGGSASIHPETA